MSKNGLHRHYDKLEPEERFRLDVLAMARGDMQESERLVNTCPRFTYTMTDRDFGGRWSGTKDLGMRVYIALSGPLGKLEAIDAFRELAEPVRSLLHDAAFKAYFSGHRSGSAHAWDYAGQDGTPPMWPDGGEPKEGDEDRTILEDTEHLEWTVNLYAGALPELMDRMERKVATQALSMWEGFAAFCREEIQLSPEKIIKVVVEPGLKQIEDLKARAERLELEPNPEIVAAMRAGFAECWTTIVERGVA